MPRALVLGCLAALAGCAVHHVTPYVPDASIAPESADAALASGNCAEAGTPAELAICASPALVAANQAMLRALHAKLREASIFGRDALLASQRGWLLALPARCNAGEQPGGCGCLASALAARTAGMQAWPAAQEVTHESLAQYVNLRPSSGASQPDAAFCAAFARAANQALRRTGGLDPAAMGYQEVAGSHGPRSAPPVTVDIYDANAFALFQRRARSVSLGGAAPAITPASLTQAIAALDTANQGGRFSAFASQTGDYAGIDVFRADSRLLAIAADPWGSTTPAAPGEAAHAGIWSLAVGAAVPVCVFDTYIRPAEPGPFESLAAFSAWRDTLNQIRDSAAPALGSAVLRDQGQMTAATDFIILHMPLLAIEQAKTSGVTPWLRHRHDQVLDALFAWSAASPANKAVFDRVFALLRPAATELVRAYQTTQGLSAAEATEAGGIAMMELLYQASATIAPALGGAFDLRDTSRPRYQILAVPG